MGDFVYDFYTTSSIWYRSRVSHPWYNLFITWPVYYPLKSNYFNFWKFKKKIEMFKNVMLWSLTIIPKFPTFHSISNRFWDKCKLTFFKFFQKIQVSNLLIPFDNLSKRNTLTFVWIQTNGLRKTLRKKIIFIPLVSIWYWPLVRSAHRARYHIPLVL